MAQMPRPGDRRPAPALAAVALLAMLAAALPARAMVGEGSDEGVEPVTSSSYTLVSPDRLAAVLKADRDYVTGMRPHHAGALTMSREYLADPEARSPVLRELAQAIIHNQAFEIALLDEVGRNLDRPARVVDLGFARLAIQPAATEGLAMPMRFMSAPIPGPFVVPGPMSVRDVQFAKGMSIHHQGALDMAHAYQANPDARNSFLRLLNVDIITAQAQEIALMRRIVATYPGDAEAIVVPASMIHGMEGMSHGGHGAQPGPAGPDAPASHGVHTTPVQRAGHAMPGSHDDHARPGPHDGHAMPGSHNGHAAPRSPGGHATPRRPAQPHRH